MNRRQFLVSSSAISAGTIGSVRFSSKPTIAANTNLTRPSNKTVSNDIEFTFNSFDVAVNNLSGQRDIVAKYSLVHNQVELRTETQTLGTTSGSGSFRANQQILNLRNFDLSKGNNQYKIRVEILVKNGSTIVDSDVTDSGMFKISCSTGGISRYTLDSDDTFTNGGTERVYDLWGSNNGTNNGVSFESGVRGQGGRLNSSNNDHIKITQDSSLDLIQGTLSGWIKLESDTGYLFHKDTTGRDDNNEGVIGMYDFNDGNGFTFRIGEGGSSTLLYTNNDGHNSWNHYCGVLDNGMARFYMNGELVDEKSFSANANTDDGWHLGIHLNKTDDISTSTDGLIDDVRFYDTALSSSDVGDLYNSYDLPQ